MPYSIRKTDGQLEVVNTESGDVKGTFPNTSAGRARAERQLRLLRGVEHGMEPRKALDGVVISSLLDLGFEECTSDRSSS